MNTLCRGLALCLALLASPTAAQPAPFAGGLVVAGWGPLVLLVAGLVLLAVEAFVLPGFGVAGVMGAVAVLAGLVIAILGPAPTAVDIFTAAWVVMAALAIVGMAVWLLVDRLPRGGRARLRASTRRDEGYVASPRRTELVGVEGVAVTDLRPSGTARFGEERVDVVTEGSFVQAGTAVRVIRADGYRHVVRAAG